MPFTHRNYNNGFAWELLVAIKSARNQISSVLLFKMVVAADCLLYNVCKLKRRAELTNKALKPVQFNKFNLMLVWYSMYLRQGLPSSWQCGAMKR